jgi:hypothetical protein
VCEQTDTIAKPSGSCPETYTLQSDWITCTKQETQSPSITCNSDFSYNSTTDQCERDSFITCN